MLILLDAPNVLILDEPSNDMGIDMLVAMENLLDSWPGTLIMVTHDRYMMERVTDHQFALIDGTLRHVPRGAEEYLEQLEAARAKRGRKRFGVSEDATPTVEGKRSGERGPEAEWWGVARSAQAGELTRTPHANP